MSATMTLAPSSAKRLEIPSPKPLPPPVTMQTLPARRLPRTFNSVSVDILEKEAISGNEGSGMRNETGASELDCLFCGL